LISFNLGKAILQADPEHNLTLQPGDVLNIFSKADIAQPLENQTKYVRLEGEVRAAGLYQMEPGETLRQLLLRTGGLTTNAYLYATVFTRESTRADQQKRQEEAVARLEMDLERAAARQIASAVSKESAEADMAQLQTRRRLLQAFKALKPSGRIVLNIPSERPGLKDLPEVVLEDGDRIFIPAVPSVLTVFGSVYNPNTFLHQAGRTTADYLAQAGGPTRDGDKGEMFLIRANGSVLGRHQAGWGSSLSSTRMMPGDTLVVPEKLEQVSFMRELKDWAQIIYQLGLGAAAIKVLK
jgi:protein involved in polysaccharide export with SLBB domain